MKLDTYQVLQDFSKRMRAHSNGVLALFREAGIETTEPTLANLHQVSEMNPDVYTRVVKFLYSDTVNADGDANWIKWANAGASALSGFFGALSGGNSSKTSEAEMLAMMQAQAQAQAAQTQKILMYVAIGIGVVVLAAVVIIFLKKKK